MISMLKNWIQAPKNRQKVIRKYWHLLDWISHNKNIDDYESIHSAYPFYLFINEVDGYIEEKK